MHFLCRFNLPLASRSDHDILNFKHAVISLHQRIALRSGTYPRHLARPMPIVNYIPPPRRKSHLRIKAKRLG